MIDANLEKFSWSRGGLYILLFICGAGIGFIAPIFSQLTLSTQATVVVSGISALGTLTLAYATFYNISQTNKTLEHREKERMRPIVAQELSDIIIPAISSFQHDLGELNDSQENEFTFDWVYFGSNNTEGTLGMPKGTPDMEPVIAARLNVSNPEVSDAIDSVDSCLNACGKLGDRFHRALLPEIEGYLEQAGINEKETNLSLRAVSVAVLNGVDSLNENHEFHDFWENYGDALKEYAEKEAATEIKHLRLAEIELQNRLDEGLQLLYNRKATLQYKYGIAGDELNFESEERV